MHDSSYNTLNTSRLFSNAIRRARRLAAKIGASISPVEMSSSDAGCSKVKAPSTPTNTSNRPPGDCDECSEPKRQCTGYSHVLVGNFTSQAVDANRLIPKTLEISKNTTSFQKTGFSNVQSFHQPEIVLSRSPAFNNMAQLECAANSALIRYLLASLVNGSLPSVPIQFAQEYGVPRNGLTSSALLQGTSWDAIMLQTPSSLTRPMLLPPSSMALSTRML